MLAAELGVRRGAPEPADLLVEHHSSGCAARTCPASSGSRARAAALVADVVYGSGPTALCRWAAQRGARVVDGLEMLVRQGAAAWSAGPVARRPSM